MRTFLVGGKHLRLGGLGRRERGLLRREQRVGERLRQAQLPARGRLAQRQPHAQRACAGRRRPSVRLRPRDRHSARDVGLAYRDWHRAHGRQAFTSMAAEEVCSSHACEG